MAVRHRQRLCRVAACIRLAIYRSHAGPTFSPQPPLETDTILDLPLVIPTFPAHLWLRRSIQDRPSWRRNEPDFYAWVSLERWGSVLHRRFYHASDWPDFADWKYRRHFCHAVSVRHIRNMMIGRKMSKSLGSDRRRMWLLVLLLMLTLNLFLTVVKLLSICSGARKQFFRWTRMI